MKKTILTTTFIIIAFSTTAITKQHQLQPQIYKKTTSQPKRKIDVRYSLVMPSSKSTKQLNKLIQRKLQQKIKAFLDHSTKPVMNFSAILKINDTVLLYQPKKLISIQYQQFINYAGAAHPITTHFTINYDIASDNRLYLRDILNNPQADLSFIANYTINALNKKLHNNDPNYIKQGAAANFKNYRHWNLTPKGLLITFDPYQVAAYVFGTQKVLIPYKLLKKRLNLSIATQ